MPYPGRAEGLVSMITNAEYADNLVLLANTPAQAESLLHNLEQAARSIGIYVDSYKTEFMCFNQDGAISSLNGQNLKFVDQFIELGNNISSPENDVKILMDCYWQVINDIDIWYLW